LPVGPGPVDLTVTAEVALGQENGIQAINEGAGDLKITATTITRIEDAGIYAKNFGKGLTITSSGTINGGANGVFAYSLGSGDLTVDVTRAASA